jgi:hypothetical protein
MPLVTSVSVFIEVRCVVTTGGGAFRIPVVNCFSYRSNPPLTTFMAGPFVASFLTDVWNVVTQELHTDLQGDGLFIAAPCNSLGPRLGSFGPPQAGQLGGNRLPLSAAVTVAPLTGKRGRHYLGLKRFGPVPTSTVSGDELAAAVWPNWAFICGNMASGFVDAAGQGWVPVVYSRALSTGVHPHYTPWLEDVVSVRFNKTLGFARHRREPTQR